MAKHSALNRTKGVRVPRDQPFGDRPMVSRQVLTLLIEVRFLIPEPTRRRPGSFFDNQIVDDARGRAPPRPRRRSRSLSGEGAWLKPRRCWFDSRREHQAECGGVAQQKSSRFISDRRGCDSPRLHDDSGGRGVVVCTARGERASESSILSGHPRGRRPTGRRCFRIAEIGVRFSAAPLRVSAPGRAVGLQSRRTAFESLLTRGRRRRMAGNGSRKPGSWRRAREVRSLRLPRRRRRACRFCTLAC
jgi:hypothetical protein